MTAVSHNRRWTQKIIGKREREHFQKLEVLPLSVWRRKEGLALHGFWVSKSGKAQDFFNMENLYFQQLYKL